MVLQEKKSRFKSAQIKLKINISLMKCNRMLSNGYLKTFKIKRNGKNRKNRKFGLTDKKKKIENHF